ncbi:MAG TPA: bifunctional 5,10-methylene-tetrahydrofolate dehydrogenase/5,10-methylene-tetrahydrofolate cyclohydrolase, partial [Microscillaceae bacterium]|nr:bifunctional 5,10-methylene-tetrahydrofolate dehydrogenase/5,10-methylene-tetrahydrofolate cyclohydrolase [Microscillaceae bacterium]
MQILDGKQTAEKLQTALAQEVAQIQKNGGKIPHLAAILVGNDTASTTYVNGKVKACEKAGFLSSLVHLSDSISENTLLEKIAELNNNPEIDGFIVQLPLPKHIDPEKVTQAIIPAKDVDGFHPVNVGRMAKNQPCYISATPFGILKLLEAYQI